MTRTLRCVALCLLVRTVSAQTPNRTEIWQPPLLIGFTEHMPKPSVPHKVVGSLRLSNITVVLDETKLTDVQAHFGATIGHRGDAAESLEWVCFQGNAGKGRRWVLWLMSGEINGPAVGGFQWRLIPSTAQVDQRCRMLPTAKSGVVLPNAVRVGMTRAELLRVLGQPTTVRNQRLLYIYEKELSINNEPFTETNLLAVLLRGETVWAIEGWESNVS